MNKKLIIALVIFAAIGVVIFYFLTTGNVGTQYNTVEVIKGEVGKQVQDTGTVSSRNIRRYYGNGVSRISELSLEIGDYVQDGQLLIKYEDNVDLEIQRVEKQIEALEASYNEVLLGTDMSSVNSARIEVSRIKSDLEMATKNKDRTEELHNIGAASLVELEEAENYVDQLQSRLGIAQNNYNQLTKEISKNIKSRYEAEIDVLLLTLEILEASKANYLVYSDIEGIVTELNTFEGDTPYPGALLIEIQDPTEKVILVNFMVEDARLIRPNMKAKVQDHKLDLNIESLKVNKVYPKAFITLSELSVEENRQTVELGPLQESESLAFGLEVKSTVMIEPPRETLMVPVGTVIHKDSKQYVKVLEKGEVVEKEIKTGLKTNENIEVIEGLYEGELIILNYQEE